MKYKDYKTLFVVLLVFIFLVLYNIGKAQEKWRSIVTSDGLPNRFIKDVKTDGKKVYIATANGVAIYDNVRKKIIKVLQEKDGLGNNYVSALAVDKDHLWIATDNGLSRFDKKTEKIVNFTKNDGLVDNNLSAVVVDGDFIWVGTKFWGIGRYDKAINKWQTFSVINGLVDNAINCMQVEGSFLWVGTKNGLSYYDKITGLWGGYDTTQGLQEGNIRSIEISGQFLWLGTINGLIRLDKYEETFKLYTTEEGLADDYIQSLTLDGIYLWIGTFSGVTRYNVVEDNWFTYTSKDGLIENSVSAMDVDGNYIWFGTDGSGISVFDKEIPQAYISPSSFYSKAGEIMLLGTAYDYNNISSYEIDYKNEAMKSFVAAGVTKLGSGNVIDDDLARWDVRKLFNINYDVRLSVTDKNGQKNTAIYSITVDTKPPQITLNILPEAVKVPTVFLRGTFIDDNIAKILININDKTKEKADLNRILKQYSKEIPLTKGLNNIKIIAYDIGNLSSEVNTKIVYDKEKPIIALDPYTKKSKEREARISGRIMDSGIQRIVLNPGNEEIPYTKQDDGSFLFDYELKLEPGFNKFEISAYDYVGNKTVINPVIEYISSLPVVSIDKSILRVSRPDYTVQGSWSDDAIDHILVEPFDERASIDMENKKFSLKAKLKKGENVITANIIDKEGNKYFDVVTVYYSTEKTSLDLLNLVPYTFQKKYLLNGFFTDPNLDKLLLKPGDIQIPVDKKNQRFSVNLDLKQGKNDFKIVLLDKFQAESETPFSIILDMFAPKVSLIKTASTVYAGDLKLQGSYDDENIDRINVLPGNTKLDINEKEKSFSGTMKLKEGLNEIMVIAMDMAGNKTEVKKSVTYMPGVVIKEPEDGKVDSKYVQELKDEIRRLRQLLRGGGVITYKEQEFRLPDKTGCVLVSFDKLKETSLFEISKKYLGNYIYIDFINKYNNVGTVSENTRLLLPTKKFIKNYVKIGSSRIKDILDIVAISFKYSNNDINKFRQKVGYFLFKKNYINKNDYNFFNKNRYINGKDFFLSINNNRASSLPFVIRVSFSKSFVNIDVKQNSLYGKK